MHTMVSAGGFHRHAGQCIVASDQIMLRAHCPTADYVDKAIEMPSGADVDPKVVLEVVLHSE